MRILVVTQYFWPEEFLINDLVISLRDDGHEVVVLTGKPNYPAGKFFDGYGFFGRARDDYQGVEVRRMPMLPRGRAGGIGLALNYLSFALIGSLMAPVRGRGEFDAILVPQVSPVTQGLPAVVLKKLYGAPILFWVQDLWPETLAATGAVRSPRVLAAVSRLVRFIYRNSSRVLIQSRAFAESVEDKGVDPAKIVYLPNTAEALYQPLDVAAADPIRREIPDGFVVMFAGNIGASQDFPTILAAAEMLRDEADIQWVVVGDGRRFEWLRGQVPERQLEGVFHLLGRRPKEQMPSYFALADVMLATLRPEPIFALTIPSKVQAYLACGRPIVIGMDGEGARVVNEAGAGWSSRAGDPASLAAAVRAAYEAPAQELLEKGRAARVFFEREFSRDALRRRLIASIEEVRAE